MNRIMPALALAVSPFLSLRRRFPLAVYVMNRVAIYVAMLLAIGLVVFGLLGLMPGDLAEQISRRFAPSGVRPGSGAFQITEEQEYHLRRHMGLDAPWYAQYLRWVGAALRGDLGVDLEGRAPVAFIIRQRLFNTVLLNAISFAITAALALALGVRFSARAGSRADLALTFFALFLYSIPPLAVFFGLQLFAFVTWLFPVAGLPVRSMAPNVFAFALMYAHHIFLLVLANFVFGFGVALRMTKMFMLDQLGQPYVLALRSRGVPERRILFRHVLRNALNPFISWGSLQVIAMLSGSIVLEVTFAFPGIGRLMADAAFRQDANVIMAVVMTVAAAVLVVMLAADIMLAFLDPRVRYGKG